MKFFSAITVLISFISTSFAMEKDNPRYIDQPLVRSAYAINGEFIVKIDNKVPTSGLASEILFLLRSYRSFN